MGKNFVINNGGDRNDFDRSTAVDVFRGKLAFNEAMVNNTVKVNPFKLFFYVYNCYYIYHVLNISLKNIFLGEDIRKQLPRESADFDDVNNNWKIIMNRLSKDSNALRGSRYPGMLDTLNEMNLKLEEIQKSLDMYLETKRQIFPRFYFLSNDDLLEILGQSKNPEAVSEAGFT